MKANKKKIILIISVIIACIAVLLIVGWWAFSVSIYNDNFNNRFESYEPLMFHVEDFEGLERTEYEFESDKGQKLKGYMYSSGDEQHGIIILAHGFGGGGHNSYMDCVDYFTKNGYYVFAYDATGNDESEGEAVGGFPQGVIDLDHAISFVEESENFPNMPIGLFGHSWGGYSVCNVLTYHPEVKAVIECSGCNSSTDILESGGKKQAGALIYTMLPFLEIHERLKFGKYASNTAMDGFEKSDAAVMVVHSADDKVVPIEYGYDIYYEKYSDDPRFVFVRYEDKGHNYIYNDLTYINEFNADFDRWMETLDYSVSEDQERFAKDKADYIHDHLDREKWSHSLDEKMMQSFVGFYDEYVK